MRDILQHFVHLGALLYFVCFLFRNQILLRSFAIAADGAYLIYYFNAADQPLWSAVVWNILILVTNSVMLTLIIRDNHVTGFSDDELKLYRSLPSLAPADFRKIVRLAKWQRTTADTTLAVQGQPLQVLHYVLEGEIQVEKDSRSIAVDSGVFVGEIAFLRQRPASATVTVKAGALYVSWAHNDLTRLQLKDPALKHAINAMLNSDLADKLARA